MSKSCLLEVLCIDDSWLQVVMVHRKHCPQPVTHEGLSRADTIDWSVPVIKQS